MRVFKVLGLIVATLLVGGMSLWSCAQDRIAECEQAWKDYVMGPPDMVQPKILTEDWCFEHLTGQD